MQRSILILAALGVLNGHAQAPAGTVTTLDRQIWEGTLEPTRAGLRVTEAGGARRTLPWSNLWQAVFHRDVVGPAFFDSTWQTVQCRTNVPLNQSATDALNGVVGRLTGDEGRERERPGLTDARTASEPDEDHGWFRGLVTWDLGPDPPAAARQLDGVSIWIRATDHSRCNYSGALAVSLDGSSRRFLPETSIEVDFDPLRKKNGRGFNQILYRFPPGRVTDFRFLHFLARTPLHGSDSRFVEVDAAVSQAEPEAARAAALELRSGSLLAGRLDILSEETVRWELRNGLELTIPLRQVTRLHLYRLPGELLRRIPARSAGVLLAQGDFLEGEIVGLAPDQVTIRSVLFGSKRLELSREVLAVAWPAVGNADAGGFAVHTAEGSVVQARSLAAAKGVLIAEEPVLGPLKLPVAELLEIQRVPLGTD